MLSIRLDESQDVVQSRDVSSVQTQLWRVNGSDDEIVGGEREPDVSNRNVARLYIS
jgi:hypothetical protein